MVLLHQDSPNIGACLCLGCWLEGGKELMGADVFEAIDWFGGNNPMGQNKLFKVVSAHLPAAAAHRQAVHTAPDWLAEGPAAAGRSCCRCPGH